MPRLLVVQPDPLGRLDRFADWLTEEGLEIRVVRPFVGERVPATLEEDALLVLGGHMSSLDDDGFAWLADIRRLLRASVDSSRPALGICLGGQLMAQAFGGTVTVGDRGVESGVVRVRWRPEARTDELFADLPTPFLAGSMHGDMVRTLPDGAVWLGHTDMYPHQAFRVATSAWGVQFHPEVSLSAFRSWVDATSGDDPEALDRNRRGLRDLERLDDEVVRATRPLAERFAAIVRESAQERPAPVPGAATPQ
ncbi:MAG: putative glutamine amidotransferase [Blastococcus sp.]|nr:putative glutamine amidotransferase [Blastococcus sp.]